MRGWVGTQVLEGRCSWRLGSICCMELQVSLGRAQGSRQAIQRYIQWLCMMRPAIVIMQGQKKDLAFYEVDAVLDRRLFNNKVYYLVKWKDFPEEEATWEHSRRLPYIRPLIRKFNANAKQSTKLSANTQSVSFVNTNDRKLRQTQPNELGLSPQYPSPLGKDEESELERPKKCTLKAIVNERQRKVREEQQEKEKLDLSEINLGGERATFGLPDSENEQDKTNAIPLQPPIIRSRHPLGSKQLQSSQEKVENSISVDKHEPAGSHAVRRVCLLQKVDEKAGKPEFFVEMEDGKMEVVSGRELMERFPTEMLAYFERLVMKKQ